MPGLRLDGCVDAVEIGEVGGIALDRRGIAADRGDRLIQFGLMAAGDKHSGALLGKMLGDAESDSAAAAGHERDFARKLPGHGEVSCDCATPMAGSSNVLSVAGSPNAANSIARSKLAMYRFADGRRQLPPAARPASADRPTPPRARCTSSGTERCRS